MDSMVVAVVTTTDPHGVHTRAAGGVSSRVRQAAFRV
jgi:phosphotransferase system HPr-like phosphotransfer protein